MFMKATRIRSPWVDTLNQIAIDNAGQAVQLFLGLDGRSEFTPTKFFSRWRCRVKPSFNATGDSDAFLPGIGQSLLPSRPQPAFITEVGGTTLTTDGSGDLCASETVWNWGNRFGPGRWHRQQRRDQHLLYNPELADEYQYGRARRFIHHARNVPDVAMTADDVLVLA